MSRKQDSTYYFKFFNCQCLNLPADEKGTCNPYIRVSVANRKIVLPKKKKTLNPEWPNVAQKFKLTIKQGESLREKKLLVAVWNAKLFGKDEKVGYCFVDLHTAATGPVNHRLKLHAEDKVEGDDTGTILFGLVMKEKRHVNVQFENMKVLDLTKKSGKPRFFMQFTSIAEQCKRVETDVIKGTNEPIWKKCSPLVFSNISMKRLKSEIMYLFLMFKKGMSKQKVGAAVLEFKKILKAKPEANKNIQLELKDPLSGDVIGQLDLNITFQNLPKYAQMTNGEHTDFACTGDTLLDDCELPDPPNKEAFDQPKEIKTFIAVDFGTTHSGYAYCSHDINDIDKVNIHMAWGEGHYRYKNKSSILYEDYTPLSWGFGAISQYNAKRKSMKYEGEDVGLDWDEMTDEQKREKEPYTLISDFKLYIPLNEDIIQNGRQFTVTKVIGDFLRLMKADIIEELNKQNYCTERKFTKWVLTVPAIWTDHDKAIMRQAALDSGILDPDFDDDDHFMFALEPESASLPCLLYDKATIKPKTKFLVLDAGGGTIDIAVYETVKPPDGTRFGIRQLQNASGGASGGKFINDRFLLFLKQNISPRFYRKIIEAFDFSELMTRWEEAKLQFKKENIEDDIFLSLPNSINSIVREIEELEDYYEEDEGDLIIPGSLFYEIYRAPIERTVEYVKEEMEKLNMDINYIFMVGGFSESPILFDAIQDNFETTACRIIKTPQPGIRVLQGATWFGKYPKIISSRCSSLTYIAKIKKVKGATASDDELYFTEAGKKINSFFKIMARAGDIIETGKKFKLECELRGCVGILEVFATSLPKIKKISPPECNKLLTINLKLKGGSAKKKKRTRLDVYVVFGDTELKFEVVNPKSAKKIAQSNYKVKFENFVDKRIEVRKSMRNILTFQTRGKYKPKSKRRRRKKVDIGKTIEEKTE